MNQDIGTAYRAHEFAEKAGVTVRALHHYDRLGLLKPSRRSAKGYRLYSDHDLVLLEQIMVLKFLDLPLKQICDVLQQSIELPEVLARQLKVLIERRNRLDRAIQVIRKAESGIGNGTVPWLLFAEIIKEIAMQNDTGWMMNYYQGEAREKVEARKSLWSPELQERVSREWADLYRDVEASLDADPHTEKAQALGVRWRRLVDEFTGGDPQITAGLKDLYADRSKWPESAQQQISSQPDAFAFIQKVFAAKPAID